MRRRARRSNRRAHCARALVSTRSLKIQRVHNRRHATVPALDVRQPAAEHDDVRIDDVDDMRKRPREALLVSRERRFAARVAWFGAGDDRLRRFAVAYRRGGGDRARVRVPTTMSRCSRSARRSRRARDARRRAATAADCDPTRRRSHCGPPARGREPTIPPPTPVPRMTPNTTSAPRAAPSVASDNAKQFASLASATARASRCSRSRFDRHAVQAHRIRAAQQTRRRATASRACRCRPAQLPTRAPHASSASRTRRATSAMIAS